VRGPAAARGGVGRLMSSPDSLPERGPPLPAPAASTSRQRPHWLPAPEPHVEAAGQHQHRGAAHLVVDGRKQEAGSRKQEAGSRKQEGYVTIHHIWIMEVLRAHTSGPAMMLRTSTLMAAAGRVQLFVDGGGSPGRIDPRRPAADAASGGGGSAHRKKWPSARRQLDGECGASF